ncbi:isochorismatase family protein [Pseudonocardiaceae bacterium YIM PH 21723]|nr:isochorismatase family protein [Pseudonocardiaceae bacterium YIM PH 21723]
MTKALIVIDVQESFRQRENWQAVSEPDIVAKVSSLVRAARAAGEPVFWVLHTEPGTGTVFDPERGFVRLLPGLEPAAGEPVITKISHNPFTTSEIGTLLIAAGASELVICGIRTEQCCETTARIGSDMGYRVTFVIDACATMPLPHRDLPADDPLDVVLADPRTLGTEAIIERTEYALHGRFATITTLKELGVE